jgi:SAM-dependent methyltransferase
MIEKWIFSEPYCDTKIGELNVKTDAALDGFENYTPDQLRYHYELEKSLAGRLKTASAAQRKDLYTSLYDELFTKLPFHPQHQKKNDAGTAASLPKYELDFLERYLTPETTFLELGAGDCRLSLEVARRVKQVYAIDVSDVITRGLNAPANFKLILSDGSSVPVPPGSVDVAYSNQLMEHLHPDDVVSQLRAVHASLRKGGKYICQTPHRFAGPSDVSRFFDQVATGFHLKEYSNRELYILFKQAGFSDVQNPRQFGAHRITLPVWISMLLESSISQLSYGLRKRLYWKMSRVISLRLVAVK